MKAILILTMVALALGLQLNALKGVEEQIHDVDNGEYYMEMQVGTPPQTLTFLLDTTSRISWIPLRNCDGCQGRRFYQNESSSFNETHVPASSQIGKVEVSGTEIAEKIHINGVDQALNLTFIGV